MSIKGVGCYGYLYALLVVRSDIWIQFCVHFD